ncbi:MAG: RNA polymerase sigma factor [Sedimentisphaerales bacterium]|nr:RNA polymerase sigma factor [Sedimentisphaerales bacterium]
MKAQREQNEWALACAARRGDREAVRVLLLQNWTWLRGLLYGVLGDAHDVDDVLQDVCLRVLAKIHTLREPERFRGWLAILARREALKHCRRRVNQTALFDGPAAPLPRPGYEEMPPDVVEKNELCTRILDAARRLPQKYREVFMLAHCGELTYAEMAKILDVPVTTMQIRLVRARRMVQNQVLGRTACKVQER